MRTFAFGTFPFKDSVKDIRRIVLTDTPAYRYPDTASETMYSHSTTLGQQVRITRPAPGQRQNCRKIVIDAEKSVTSGRN